MKSTILFSPPRGARAEGGWRKRGRGGIQAAHFRAEKLRAETEKRDINWEVALEKYNTDGFSWNGDKPKTVVVFWSYKAGADWCHEATEMNYKQLLL